MPRRHINHIVTPWDVWIDHATATGSSPDRSPRINQSGSSPRLDSRATTNWDFVPLRGTRRGFLHAGGLATAGLLIAPTGVLAGCSELVTIFKAIEVALEFFGVKDDVYGLTLFKNSGGKDVRVETLLDLFLGSKGKGMAVDEGFIDPIIPADGREYVVDWEGLEPSDPGTHFVEGTTVKKTRRTLDFTVTPA